VTTDRAPKRYQAHHFPNTDHAMCLGRSHLSVRRPATEAHIPICFGDGT
jgi:hypothetical protein